MKCPNCSAELKMSERSGVEIDYCPQCRGVWLDKGELDKIIDRSNDHYHDGEKYQEKENYSREKQYDHDKKHYDHDKKYPYKKKKGFLGDMFDVFD